MHAFHQEDAKCLYYNAAGFTYSSSSRAVYASFTLNLGHPFAIRAYPSPQEHLNPTLVDALCATMAFPPFFSDVAIGKYFERVNLGGALGATNPTRELLDEAAVTFGENSTVALVLSIGCGKPSVLSSGSSSDPHQSYQRLLNDMTRDCEMVAKMLSTKLVGLGEYLRLNVDKGMDLGINDDWTKLGVIESHTETYLESAAVSEAVDASLTRLVEKTGSKTLTQICTCTWTSQKKYLDFTDLALDRPHHRQRLQPRTSAFTMGLDPQPSQQVTFNPASSSGELQLVQVRFTSLYVSIVTFLYTSIIYSQFPTGVSG